VIVRYNESHAQANTFISIQSSYINVKACRCDSLYRTARTIQRRSQGGHGAMPPKHHRGFSTYAF